MPVIPKPTLSNRLLSTINDAAVMHRFIQGHLPDSYTSDGGKLDLIARLYSLALEHHAAILHLLHEGVFDGSAFALARPLVEATFRGYWLSSCAKPATVQRIIEGGDCYPPLKNMAEAVEEKMQTDGLFTAVLPHIQTLHGFTHGGIEQLIRRADEDGNIQPSYSESEKLRLIKSMTAYLTMFSIAWCQLIATAPDNSEPRSTLISEKYVELFGTTAV